jgi:DNA-directed RNA polymerase specialized sigma subunit
MSKYNSELVSQMSPPLNVEDNLGLAPKVALGDVEARKSMIEGNMPLVVSKVDDYIFSFPQYTYLRDDLTSAGFVGLVNAVNSIAKDGSGVAAPVEYIGVSIMCQLIQFTDDESMIRIPHKTQYNATANGKRIRTMTPSGAVPDTCACDGAETLAEMRDLIESCCETEQERTYVDMREASYNLQEIAAVIGTSLATTYRLKENLYRRVLAKAGLRDTRKAKQ